MRIFERKFSDSDYNQFPVEYEIALNDSSVDVIIDPPKPYLTVRLSLDDNDAYFKLNLNRKFVRGTMMILRKEKIYCTSSQSGLSLFISYKKNGMSELNLKLSQMDTYQDIIAKAEEDEFGQYHGRGLLSVTPTIEDKMTR